MKNSELIAPNTLHTIPVPEDTPPTRIDQFIAKQFPLYSRSFFSKLINGGHISLNGTPTTKPSALVQTGDTITLFVPPSPQRSPESLAAIDPLVHVINQTPHFLIVYKPAGLTVHAPSTHSTETTLVDWIVANYKEIERVGCIDRPGIVHRLDKDTSGLIIIPRTNFAHTTFSELFHDRKIHKTYHALVKGHPDKKGSIDLPIGRDPHVKTRMSTKFPPGYTGKTRTAQTDYTVLKYFDDAALVEAKPVSGRTHQIRVHLAAIGHPIIGDAVYGQSSKGIDRHALHAAKLNFMFDGTEYEFESPMADDMQTLMNTLQSGNKIGA